MFSSFSSWAYFMKYAILNTIVFLKTLKPSGAQKEITILQQQ